MKKTNANAVRYITVIIIRHCAYKLIIEPKKCCIPLIIHIISKEGHRNIEKRYGQM